MAKEFLGYFITEEEYRDHLRTKKSAIRTGSQPHLKVSIFYEFDIYSFNCRFSHKSNGYYGYLGKSDMNIVPINDFFEKGKCFYVTTNGFIFYSVLDIHVDINDYFEISMKMITSHLYTEKNHFFMIMPFGEAYLNSFYHNNIKTFLKERLDISIYRADDFNHNDVIIDTIYQEIEKSEIIICDITLANKNVFYEIGYAKAKNKELIFLMQQGTEHKFFDVAHIQRIDYDLNIPITMQERLVDTIRYIRGKW